MSAPPQWASELVAQVCEYERRAFPPRLVWRRAHPRHGHPRQHGSSGRTDFDGNRIVVTAGSSTKDARLVLLHEMAHALSPIREHHGPLFWAKAWDLYERFGVPLVYALVREAGYRKASIDRCPLPSATIERALRRAGHRRA